MAIVAGPSGTVAKAWFDMRSDKTYVMCTCDFCQPKFGKALEEGWSGWNEDVVRAVAIAAVTTSAIPGEALITFLRNDDLVPDGSLPRDRAVRKFMEMVLKDLKSMGDRHSARKTVLRERLRRTAIVIPELVHQLSDIFGGLDEVKAREALEEARMSLRKLASLRVEFDKIKKVWDEEVVRAVQES